MPCIIARPRPVAHRARDCARAQHARALQQQARRPDAQPPGPVPSALRRTCSASPAVSVRRTGQRPPQHGPLRPSQARCRHARAGMARRAVPSSRLAGPGPPVPPWRSAISSSTVMPSLKPGLCGPPAIVAHRHQRSRLRTASPGRRPAHRAPRSRPSSRMCIPCLTALVTISCAACTTVGSNRWGAGAADLHPGADRLHLSAIRATTDRLSVASRVASGDGSPVKPNSASDTRALRQHAALHLVGQGVAGRRGAQRALEATWAMMRCSAFLVWCRSSRMASASSAGLGMCHGRRGDAAERRWVGMGHRQQAPCWRSTHCVGNSPTSSRCGVLFPRRRGRLAGRDGEPSDRCRPCRPAPEMMLPSCAGCCGRWCGC